MPLLDSSLESIAAEEPLWSAEVDPSSRVEAVVIVRDALAHLDPADRLLLALRYCDDRTQQEIAAMLGVSQQAVSLRLALACKRMKRIIECARRNAACKTPRYFPILLEGK